MYLIFQNWDSTSTIVGTSDITGYDQIKSILTKYVSYMAYNITPMRATCFA